MVTPALRVGALDGLVVAADLRPGLGGPLAVVDDPMIGYTERATRCSGSRNRIEWSSTPAPSSGYMFWIAPIHTPSMPVRTSPKYFHVSESGPSGLSVDAVALGWGLRPVIAHVQRNVDNIRCLRNGRFGPELLFSLHPAAHVCDLLL